MAKKKPATKEESEHLARIKELHCVICKDEPVDVHHITKCGRRLGHKFTLPLCFDCHRGDRGFSGENRSAWDKSLENQLRLLKKVEVMLQKEYETYIYRRDYRERF